MSRFNKIKAEKKRKEAERKQREAELRKHMANLRIIQKTLVYVIGLSPRMADEEVRGLSLSCARTPLVRLKWQRPQYHLADERGCTIRRYCGGRSILGSTVRSTRLLYTRAIRIRVLGYVWPRLVVAWRAVGFPVD